jgi:pimeloyl-ACP methyl ester carboxylesterase
MTAPAPRLVSAGGHRLEYRRIAAARADAGTIVFLHEGLGSVSQWRDFPQRLCERTGLPGVVYSRYGHGRSERLSEARTPDFMHAEALTALPELLAALGVHDPILFGHSDGASIAAIYAGAHPGRVRALVLEAPHFFVEARSVEGIRAAGTAFAAGPLRERLARHHDDADGMFRGWHDAWLAPAFRGWNIETSLATIRCPILAMQGGNDEYGSMAQIDVVARRAPGTVELLKLAGCGHVPHREQQDAVLDACAAFLACLP